jgi:hypothetical protein
MFGLGKKKTNLVFKSNEAALEYSAKFMDCKLRKGLAMPAIVTGLGEYSGGLDRGPDDCHVVRVRIPTEDGSAEVVGITSIGGITLKTGELVEWVCTTLQTSRIGGVIIGKLTAELGPEGWKATERFERK